MTLELIDFWNGLFSLGVLVFTVLFGIRIIMRYFKYKRIEFLLFGFCAILIAEPWWPHSVAFIYALVTGSEQGLVPQVYFIIGNVLIPLAVFLWLWVYSELTIKDKQKQYLQLGAIYILIFEVLFFTMLIIDPLLVGELQGPIHVQYNIGLISLLLSGVIIAFITGTRFIQFSLRSDNPEIKFRGKLIFIAVVFLISGAVVEGLLSSIVAFLIFSRILLLFSGFWFFIGLAPPEIIRRKLSNLLS